MTATDILRVLLADRNLVYLASLIGAALLVGIASALYTKTFQLANVADFVEHQLIPIMLGYLTAELLGWGNALLVPVKDIVFTALCLRLLASITGNLALMGIALPNVLTGQIKPIQPVKVVSPVITVPATRSDEAKAILQNAGARRVRVIPERHPKVDTPSYGDSS